jgi:peroxiredoxin
MTFLSPLSLLLFGLATMTVYTQPNNASAQGSGEHPVASRAEDICPLLLGRTVPVVSVQTSDGSDVGLPELIGGKPTILIFYRGGWCPYCNLQLSELQEIEPKLLELGYQIIAISPDRPEKLAPAVAKSNLSYRLFSDSKLNVAKAFGLAFKVDEKVVARYQTINIDLDEASGESHHMLPVPGAYVIGADGIIAFSYVNPNYKVRLPGNVLLAAARATVGEE